MNYRRKMSEQAGPKSKDAGPKSKDDSKQMEALSEQVKQSRIAVVRIG